MAPWRRSAGVRLGDCVGGFAQGSKDLLGDCAGSFATEAPWNESLSATYFVAPWGRMHAAHFGAALLG